MLIAFALIVSYRAYGLRPLDCLMEKRIEHFEEVRFMSTTYHDLLLEKVVFL